MDSIFSGKLIKYFHISLLGLLSALIAQYGYYIINDADFTFSDEFMFLDFFRNRRISPIGEVEVFVH